MVDNIEQYRSILNFENPDHAYILSYAVRKKDDAEKGMKRFELHVGQPDHEFFRTRVIANMTQFDRYIEQFIWEGDQKGYQYRIYGTYNPHSLRKAYIELTKKVTELILWEPGQANLWLASFEMKFRSHVHRPTSKAITRYHMLDMDREWSPDELPEYVKIEQVFRSKNGYNILYQPCNPSFVQNLKDCELKTDAQINVYIK
jgi:hypothetical protein